MGSFEIQSQLELIGVLNNFNNFNLEIADKIPQLT
jgi:hypothetical protein